MDIQRKLELVNGLAEAKGRQDIDAALDFQHADMVLSAPAIAQTATGIAANREALSAFFAAFPDYRIELDGHADDGTRLTFWGTAHMTFNGSLLGLTSNGRTAELPVFLQFTFGDDLIASELFFFDLADLCSQSEVSTDAVRSLLFGA